MPRNKTIVRQQAPNLTGQPQVDFRKSDFEAAVEQKGYRVIREKTFKCPCASKTTGSHGISSCQNCGGTGYVFVNKIETRMILSSMNLTTQYKEWSEEKLGTVAISMRDIDKVAFMDRLTLLDGESISNELLYPEIITIKGTDKLTGFTFYDIDSIEAVFLFESATSELKLLENLTDYTYQYNRIVLSKKYNNLIEPTVSIRYKHKPQFFVIDIPRDIMFSPIINKTTGRLEDIPLPLHAIARRAHFVLDRENYIGDRIFDNSYGCNE